MEIKLTENQIKIISQIQTEKSALLSEYNKVVKRENEIMTVILEAHDFFATEPTKVEIKDNVLIVHNNTKDVV